MTKVQLFEAARSEPDAVPDSTQSAVIYWRLADQLQFGRPQGGAVWVQRGVAMRLHQFGYYIGNAKIKCGGWGAARDAAEEAGEMFGPWLETLAHLMVAEGARVAAAEIEAAGQDYTDASREFEEWGDSYTENCMDEAASRLAVLVRDSIGDSGGTASLKDVTAGAILARRTEEARHRTAALTLAPDLTTHEPFGPEWEGPWVRPDIEGYPTDLAYFVAFGLLQAWRLTQPATTRDSLIRWALDAGASKATVSQLTGVARTTIDRILTPK